MPINTKKLKWKRITERDCLSIYSLPYDPDLPHPHGYQEAIVVVIGYYNEEVIIPASEMQYDIKNSKEAQTNFVNYLFNTGQLIYPLEVMI